MHDGKLFLKSLTIKNFRCFEQETVELNVPDGTLGGGITLLVGDNGNGKTTVLEAVNHLYSGRFAESRLDIGDFFDFEKPIEHVGACERFSCFSGSDFLKDSYFNCLEIKFTAESRDRKQSGRFLSEPITAKSVFVPDENTYFSKKTDELKTKDGDAKPVDSRDLVFDLERVNGEALNVFYFDKNRARHLASGTYRTTFDKIAADLDWKFRKAIKDKGKVPEYESQMKSEFFDLVSGLAQKGIGTKIADELASFFGVDAYKNLRIDLIELLKPFSGSFFAVRQDGNLKQLRPKDLGSGVELILAILLQKLLSEQAKGHRTYLIDEPEMHLHPRAQTKLADLLLEESKVSQIVISSHSPYLLQALLDKCGALVFGRPSHGKIQITKHSATHPGIFPWSPSFAEVNYRAFGVVTNDLHNEIYGYTQEKHNLGTCIDVDAFLVSKGEFCDRDWQRSNGKNEKVTASTYVRHSIHHPENKKNAEVDSKMLGLSIETLLKHI